MLPVNRWGYSFAKGDTVSDSYVAMPATLRSSAIDNNANTNITDETRYYMLSFAARIGSDKPAGTYTNSVTMSVVSSPLEITSLTALTNMQDMTSAICAASEVGDTKQLKDVRDGKYYWVGKLADGKCWMTQNLDLDLSTGTKLTSDTSDVPAAGYIPAYSTATTADSSTILDDNTGQRSWSLGNVRITNPNMNSDCGYPKNSAANCTSQFTTAGGSTPTTRNGDELAHYILGNHYQWNAATAGTGDTVTGGQATNSICPKGWRLPTSGSSGEFQALANVLGASSDVMKFTNSPFYGVKGGIVANRTDILFAYAGNVGRYWSSTPESSGFAYSLSFNWNNVPVNSSLTNGRNNGCSVRCIAR